MRLDLSVNILTFSALKYGVINVFGGNQLRPNIHILGYDINIPYYLRSRCVDVRDRDRVRAYFLLEQRLEYKIFCLLFFGFAQL